MSANSILPEPNPTHVSIRIRSMLFFFFFLFLSLRVGLTLNVPILGRFRVRFGLLWVGFGIDLIFQKKVLIIYEMEKYIYMWILMSVHV